MKTVLCHFYNEEYLLPFWLKHHKKYFDYGIMINYGSTDKSVEIIKEICPDWLIVDTQCPYFYAPWTDAEMVEYEKRISGYRICLNVTEFLIGNYDVLQPTDENVQYLIRSHLMVDKPGLEFTELKTDDLFTERSYGIPADRKFNMNNGWSDRSARSLHNYLIHYPSVTGPGRHFMMKGCPNPGQTASEDFVILWYGYSPFNTELIKRKLQIQTKHHPNGQWTGGHNISEQQLIDAFRWYQSQSMDLAHEIKKFI